MKYYWLLTIVLAAALVVVSARYAEEKGKNEKATADAVSGASRHGGMDAIECIMTRASVRKYKTDAVPDSLLEKVLRAGMAAPSAVNKQPWEFVVVNDRELLLGINREMPNVHCQDCPIAIVVCGNTEKALEGEGRGYWIQDTSAATENMLLAAHALGLGTVWCGLTPIAERVAWMKKYLNLPSELEPLCIVCLGWPDGETAPKDKWNPDVIHYNRL